MIIRSCSLRYPELLADFAAKVNMVSRFPTVSEEDIFPLNEAAILANTKFGFSDFTVKNETYLFRENLRECFLKNDQRM